MPVTETEAAAMWCPFSRVALYGVTVNRSHPDRPQEMMTGIRCLGQKCMAWRWEPGQLWSREFIMYFGDDASTRREPPKPHPVEVPLRYEWTPRDPDDADSVAGWRETEDDALARFRAARLGHCGLVPQLEVTVNVPEDV